MRKTGLVFPMPVLFMNTTRKKFHKSERLCSQKIIGSLFEKGNVFYSGLFRVVWDISPAEIQYPAQVAFSIPKKNFRIAVTRNLLRRRMKEAYRNNKHTLYDLLIKENIQIIFIVIYRKNTVADFQTIENAMKEIFDKLKVLIREIGKKC